MSRVEPGVRKIAVLRANALGDLIFALPALEALRATYPEAELTLLARDWHRGFLEARPGPVDRVIAVPSVDGIPQEGDPPSHPEEVERFFSQMRAEGFDLALQMHGGGRHSNPFVLRLEAGLTAGTRTPDAPALDRWIRFVYYQQEVLRYLEIAALVGAAAPFAPPRLAVTDGDRAEAQRALAADGRRLAVLHPGATDSRRRWPPTAFAAVGDALAETGLRVGVTGTGGEAPVVGEVVEAMRHPAEDLCDRLSLSGLTGLLAQAAVVVSNDSGPLHLAAAVGAPTVGIFWCGNLINGGHPWRRRHRQAISWQLDCPVCGVDCTKGECVHRESFVADVSVGEVLSAALDLLDC